MDRRVDPPGQAADDRQPRTGEAGRQAFGLPQSIGGAVAGADDADRQGIGWFEPATDKEQPRRVGNLAQARG